VGFAAKRFAPRANLGILLAAPMFLDILWPPFLLLGWERVRIDPGNTRFTPFDFTDYPWSHSLLMSVVWASSFALVYHLITRYRPGTLAVWVGVVSHWVLDWVRIVRICRSIRTARVTAWGCGTPSRER
jgi:membrane-bound metal-dependent hydrolase YbcI (DUF457 family)